MRSKATPTEVVIAMLLSFCSTGCALSYVVDGGRGWAFGAFCGLLFLIALVAGIAEDAER